MARGSLGAKLINGVVKAISKANKEEQKSRLKAAREDQKRIQKAMNAARAELQRVQRIGEAEDAAYQRTLLAEKKRIEKENEKLIISQAKEKQLKLKEEERAQIKSEKDAKRNAELQQKENIRRAIAEFDEELSQGNAFFRERCNERHNLRLDYIRRLLK